MKNVLQLAKKSIALTLALSLLYSQVLWAADVRQMLLDAKASFDLDDTRRGDGLSAEELEAAQDSQQSEVDQQQALQDLQGMNFSLTTQNGDILSYVGNVLKEVKRPDGTVLKNLVTDAQGMIQSADLRLSDGSIQVLRNGEVVAYELPDGTEVFYESGRIQKTVTPQGLETLYSYTYDADQNLLGIALENIHTRTLASPDGKIKEVLKKSDNSVTSFSSNGLIEKITYSDGGIVQFQLVPYGNDQKIIFHTYTDSGGTVSYEAPEGLLAFEYLLYRADGSIKEALLSDGQKLKFSEEGTLTEAEDSYGHSVSISFQESALSNILGTQIVQGGLATTYNAKGELESIRFGELTIYYKDSVLDYAKLDDGTILRNLLFDEAGNLSSANVTTSDGEERLYENGKLTSLTKPDETKLFYFDDKITQLLTPQGLSYNFNYEPETIQATLNTLEVPDALTPVRMEYDGAFNLKKIILQNAEILNYLDDRLISSLSQNGSQTFYDEAGNILKTVIAPTQDNPHTLEVIYKYGKIREILKDGVLTFKYTYTFDEEGNEITTIEDLEEKSLKTYQDGLLLTSLSIETSVLSTYTYNDDDKVSQVQVTRFGRVLHTYAYAYEETHTIVTDEEGIKRTYSDNQKLLFLEKEGKKFSYEYWLGADGQEIVEEKLVEMALTDGAKAFFIRGDLDYIELSDGSVLTDILVEEGVLKEAIATLSDGRVLTITPTGVTKESRPDGTQFIFEDNILKSVQDPVLGELSFSEEKDPNGNLLAVWITKGDFLLKYNPTGALVGVKVPGVMTPKEVFQNAQHIATGGSNPTYGYDGNFNTAQVGGQTTLRLEHIFQGPQVISSLSYRLSANAWSNGSTNNGSSAESYLETKDATTGLWTQVPGTRLYQSHSNGGGGGSTANADTSNPATVTIAIQNVIGIRAHTWSSAYSNGGGGSGGSTAIWEVAPNLLDQSFLNYNAINKTFTNYRNTIQDLSGLFGENLPSFTTTPHQEKIHNTLPLAHQTWVDLLGQTASNSELVTIQEYSHKGVLEVQKKADRTYTLFENNKPKLVLNEEGEALIEYTYDAQGHPIKVHLKHARESLPKEIEKARLKIEEDRAKTLRELAAQKNLAYNTIYAQSKTQKDLLNINLNDIKNQYNGIASQSVHGSAARSQKAQGLSQIQVSIDGVMGYLRDVSRNEADAYAQLDAQVKALSDQINNEATSALTQLAAQENTLKREILRQEVSPVIFDHYRRILGRDPSTQEYDSWISKLNYETGQLWIRDNIEERLKPAGSVYMDGNGDYLSLSDSTDWAFSTGSFTIDFWVRFNDLSTSQNLLGQREDSDNRWYLTKQSSSSGNRLRFYWIYDAEVIADYTMTNSYAAATNVFYHVALQRSGSSIKLFIGGKEVPLAANRPVSSNSLRDIRGSLTIGQQNDYSYLNGYLDELRISKGIARYSANFTPSKTPYTTDSYTKLLLRSEPGSSTPFRDESGLNKTVTGYGNARQELTKFVTQEKYTVKTPIYGAFIPTLSAHVNSLPELFERTAYVNSIKVKVVQKINSFLLMSDLEKESFALSLGLSKNELIPLSSIDAQKILVWLESRSLHFGQSAFLSLEALLDQKGISYAREDIAERAILIDVLTGIISPLDDGDLVISMFALNKVASLYNLALSGANLSFEDLLAIYQANPTAKIVAHVNGNHYVVIQSVTATSATYMDTGRGKDKQNEVATLSKGDFLKTWKGDVTADSVILNAAMQREGSEARILSATQTQKIRGSFFFLLIPAIIGAISQIGAAVWAVLNGIGALIAGLGQLVGGIITHIGYALNTLGQGLSQIGYNLFNGIKFAFSSIFGQQGFFATFANQSFFGSAAQATFGEQIFQNAVSIGVKFAVSRGLEALGVNPVITNLVSSFATGGVVGGFQAGFSAVNLIQGGIKALALTGTQTLLESAGLDTSLTQTLSLAAGQFVDGLMQGNLGGQLVKIGQSLSTNLSMYGLEKLGTYLGLSPTVAMAFSAPISLTIGQGLTGGNIDGEQIIRSVQDGLYNGAVRYSLDFAVDKMGIDNPLLQGLASSAITTSISSFLDPNGNLLSDVLERASSQIVSMLDLISTPDFNRLVQQQGISKALEQAATSVFTRSSQEDIIKAGGIAQLISGRAELVNLDGVTLRHININSNESFYLDSYDNLVALQRTTGTASEIYSGNFSITDKGAKLINGVIGTIHLDGSVSTIEVRDGKTYEITISKTPGISNITRTQGPEGEAWFTFDIQPDQTDLVIRPNETDVLNIDGVTLMDGSAVLYSYGNLFQIDISNGHGSKISMDSNGGSSGNTAIQSGLVKYLLLNGIRGGVVPEGAPADYFDPASPNSFVGTLADSNVDPNTVKVIPMFEEFGFSQDILNWIVDWFGFNNEMNKIIQNLNQINDNQTEPFVPLAYSGSGQPLLKALDTLTADSAYYNVDTVIMVGSPSNKTEITNPNINTIINVYGQWDVFLEENILNVDTWQEFLVQATRDELEFLTQGITHGTLPIPKIQKSYTGAQTINIELLGIGHTDYFVNPDSRANATPLQLKAELFLARLASFAESTIERDQFLDVFPRGEDDSIIVDLNAWEPN